MSSTTPSIRSDLMWELLRAFTWLDRSLQENLAARGHPRLGATESQIMFFVAAGIDRPSEIARQLGLSRQAVHKATAVLVERGQLSLVDDPEDGRGKRIVFRAEGEAHRRDARDIIERLERELESRLGKRALEACAKALRKDWGEPPRFE